MLCLQDSPMLIPAERYLILRSLGAPAVLLSLAMQGVFRGIKDTKTPLYATGEMISCCIPLSVLIAELTKHSMHGLVQNFWYFTCWYLCSYWRCGKHCIRSHIYICILNGCQWCSHCTCHFSVSSIFLLIVAYTFFVVSYLVLYLDWCLQIVWCGHHDLRLVYGYHRYLISIILLWKLIKHVDLLSPSMEDLQIGRFLKTGEAFFIFLLCVCVHINCLTFLWHLSVNGYHHWCILDFSVLPLRVSSPRKSNSCNSLCHSGSIIGYKARIYINGCISGFLADLVGDLFACWWSGCGWTGKKCELYVNAITAVIITPSPAFTDKEATPHSPVHEVLNDQKYIYIISKIWTKALRNFLGKNLLLID